VACWDDSGYDKPISHYKVAILAPQKNHFPWPKLHGVIVMIIGNSADKQYFIFLHPWGLGWYDLHGRSKFCRAELSTLYTQINKVSQQERLVHWCVIQIK